MAIKLLKQNLEYFRYPNNKIKVGEIDNRFNDIVHYLNDEIIFKLNNINDNIIIGSTIQIDINSILKSKNEDGYYWKKIDNNDFIDNSIPINKVNHKSIKNSIFISNSDGELLQLPCNNLSSYTIICDNNGIKFNRISNNYIDPLTKITGDKIQDNTITAYNLSNIISTIGINTIDGRYFADRAIKTSNIQNNSIKLDRFDENAKEHLQKYIWAAIIPKGFIDLNSSKNIDYIKTIWNRDLLKRMLSAQSPAGRKLDKPYIIPTNKFVNFRVKNIIKYYSTSANITDLSLTTPSGKKVGAEKRYILTPNLFKPNSINPNRLVYWYAKGNYKHAHNINNIIAIKSITIDHLTAAIAAKVRGI